MLEYHTKVQLPYLLKGKYFNNKLLSFEIRSTALRVSTMNLLLEPVIPIAAKVRVRRLR